MFQKINISIADKIGAAQTNATDPNMSTASVPSNIDGSPGDSAIQQPDLSGINSAGPDVTQQQSNAQTQTGPNARKSAVPQDVTYDRPGDAEFPAEQDPQKQTPTPKTKSFKESLIDKKSQQESQKPTPEAQNPQKGQHTPDPTIAKAQDNKRVERTESTGWSPSKMGINDPGMPDQNLMDGILDRGSKNPSYSNGQTYKPMTYNTPKIATPRMPRLK